MSWQTDVSVWTDKPETIQVFSDDGREQDYVPERTCHMECVPMFPGTDSHFLCWECSDCSTTNDENRKPNYCPNCGAKVVDE